MMHGFLFVSPPKKKGGVLERIISLHVWCACVYVRVRACARSCNDGEESARARERESERASEREGR